MWSDEISKSIFLPIFPALCNLTSLQGPEICRPGADPCVTANKASQRRGWVFDSTLGRKTCSPVFSPVSEGTSKGRHSDKAKCSVATKQKILLWFYFLTWFCFSFSTFIFHYENIECKMNVLKKIMKELFNAWNLVVEEILQSSVGRILPLLTSVLVEFCSFHLYLSLILKPGYPIVIFDQILSQEILNSLVLVYFFPLFSHGFAFSSTSTFIFSIWNMNRA